MAKRKNKPAKNQGRDPIIAAIDSERAVLGSLMLDSSKVINVARIVKARHFARPGHKAIYLAIMGLSRDDMALDPVTVGEALENQGKLNEAGGMPYLVQLVEKTPTSSHAEHYARQVYHAAKRNEIIEAAGSIAKEAYDESKPFDRVLPKVRQIIDQVDDHDAQSETGAVEDALMDLMQPRPDPWSTGVRALDTLMGGGLAPGRIIVITGRSGLGKTWIATGMEVSALDAGISTLDFTLEMSRSARVARFGAAKFGADHMRLLGNSERWTKEDRERFGTTADWIIQKELKIFERQFDIRSISTLVRIHNPKMVVIDYYQNLARPSGCRSNDDADQELSREIEKMVQATGCCCIVVSQLNKDGSMKYGSWLNNRCDGRLHIEPEPDSDTAGMQAIKVTPQKMRHAPDADSGAEEILLMDKTRGRLVPMSRERSYNAQEHWSN